MRQVAGHLDASSLSFGIVLARFNSRVGEMLLSGAMDALIRHGVDESKVTVIRVPGSFEIPAALRGLCGNEKSCPDALIALGALVRGETPHFDYLASTVTRALDRVAEDAARPVANGVLTCDTMEQALDRAGGKTGNKGFEAAMTAIEMANLMREM